MRQIRNVLRHYLEGKLTVRECAAAVGLPKSTVNDIVGSARVADVDWAMAQTLSDEQLEARLYPPSRGRAGPQTDPDYVWIHRELKRTGVTLQLLWEEYLRDHPSGYRYTAFCTKYRAWAGTLQLSMRQVHIAGEKLFVDYAGPTIPLINGGTGEITQAQLFVGVLGASNYTYACATATQTTIDWVQSIIANLEFIGGVPRLLVPDQTRALIAKPHRYDPSINALVAELEAHYGVVMLPARPASPRDKAKVEGAVLLAERWIIACIRNRRFFTLTELNGAIAELLPRLNERPFKKLPGCRLEAFTTLDRPVLRPLPEAAMELAQFKRARVNIDYHVEYDGHYYSVPYRLVRQEVDLRITATTLEVLHSQQRVAAHVRSYVRGGFTTLAEHMPSSHRAHREWTPGKLVDWGKTIGVATAEVVQWQMDHRPHPEQGYRACLGLRRLAKQYTAARLEAACTRALTIRSPGLRSITSILKLGLDRTPLADSTTRSTLPAHDNVRGPDYYH